MMLARISLALALLLGGSPVLAKNWVKVFELDPFPANVDKDSIRRGSDNLVYFAAEAPFPSDNAVDCQKKLLYLVKLEGYPVRPNWRNNGKAVVADTMGGAVLQYVCANAPAERRKAR